MQEKRPLWRRGLRRILGVLLILVLLLVFYIAAVMGQPQGNPVKPKAPAAQQVLQPMGNVLHIDSEEQLSLLGDAFPAPVMYPAFADDLTFAGGILKDTAYEGSMARLASLTYRTEDGAALTIVSIIPARALDLMGRGDYRNASAGPSLAGIPSARMENDDTIRLHAQGRDALYVLTLPRSLANVLHHITSSMQLMSPDP